MNISFVKVTPEHLALIMEWLNEPHMIEFWDNSQEHKDDITNFAHGRPQTYFGGGFKYWLGLADEQPYALVLSEEFTEDTEGLPDLHYQHMSENGLTVGLDFGIGNTDFLGKGLAAPTLVTFMAFYRSMVPAVDTFLIDPDPNNPRAVHVYEKAGFQRVGTFIPTGGAFVDDETLLMVRKY